MGKYLIVGIFAFLVDFCVFASLLDTHLILAQCCARISGAVFGFFGHKYFTYGSFGNEKPLIVLQIIRYIVLWVSSFGLSMILLIYFVNKLMIQPYYAKLYTESIIILFNFFVMKIGVFNEKGE